MRYKTKITKALLGLLMLLLPLTANGQITIGGSIYGGGNEGDVNGKSTVTVHAGDLNRVYGGARKADVGGRAYVNIDGEHASDFILINYVYGGNDVSGTIGSSETLPPELPVAETAEYGISNIWNAFVRISTKTTTSGEGENAIEVAAGDAQKVYIGQLFGGGNGDYDYENQYLLDEEGNATNTPNPYFNLPKPDLDRTYLQLHGGSIVCVYGGGNNATVNEKTVICLNNPSKVVNSILDATGNELLTVDRTRTGMGLNPSYTYPTDASYQIGNFYGGNNTAEMKIRPDWHIKQGKIRNLYSGGNRGAMTSPEGLLLDINPPAKYANNLIIENVYGGCRMADVCPKVNGQYVPTTNLQGYNFPDTLSARLLVRGGIITNVYGGNDITGKVYGGNAIGVYTNVLGDVYGGGNGSYPYTDNPKLKDDDTYGDFYYTIPNGKTSAQALNDFRPNAEKVSLRIAGKAETTGEGENTTTTVTPTIIRGSIYLGGNSASLKSRDGETMPMAEFKIGSYVIADKVFLGNNGENMVKTNEEDASNGIHEGVLRTMARPISELGYTGESSKFNSMQLTGDNNVFADYMKGASMEIIPRIVFDKKNDDGTGDPETYEQYSSYFGSFYCGGNVGSMIKDGCETINFTHKVTIFDKLVGGCNNAFVPESEYNVAYEGGMLGSDLEMDVNGYVENGKIKDRLVLNLSGLKIQPRRWKQTYGTNTNSPENFYENYLEWNTIDSRTNEEVPAVTEGTATELNPEQASANDMARRFAGGNIYGGCYTSGVINGNVVINLNNTLIERDKLFDEVTADELGEEESLYGADQTTQVSYNITKRNTGVILGRQGMDVMGKALNVFGGGKGAATEVWGSTTINLNRGYTFQIFGGSEEGVIGRPVTSSDYAFTYKLKDGNNVEHTYTEYYTYDPKYSCTVNVRGTKAGVSKKAENISADMADAEFIYGGGFFGPIAGNTVINLGKGRVFNTFAGSCNADILGHTETYIGRQVNADGTYGEGFPWIRDIVYGGNDLGGEIKGSQDFSDRLTDFATGKIYAKATGANKVTTASAYVEYLQGRADAIFGGCYGTYDYNTTYSSVTKPFMTSAFVNFRPTYTNDNNIVKKVFGSGQGYPAYRDGDKMQDRSYVLVDIPQDMSYYTNMEVFGAGSYNGLGMRFTYESGTDAAFDESVAVVDLLRGQVGAAYGASFNEGVTRHTLVNVPNGSTIKIGSIFGGAYGMSESNLRPCDVFDANVEYHSADAVLVCNPIRKDDNGDEIGNELQKGAIYGGNNNQRRTIYGKIHIDKPVVQQHWKFGLTTATVYGAGYGPMSWSEYTEVVLDNGADVYEVYGGGEQGLVLNAESVQAYMNFFKGVQAPDATQSEWEDAWKIGGGYDPASTAINTTSTSYIGNAITNMHPSMTRLAEMDNRPTGRKSNRYNTNVIIKKGAYVGNYAYGGGLGDVDVPNSGNVYGSTYIALLGGTIYKDIYAAGTIGGVYDLFGANQLNPDFVASTNAYIEGGTLRNVFGGGWKGDVGYHPGVSGNPNDISKDVLGETNVVIGIRKDQAMLPDGYGFYKGVPAIKRNAYAGGEGGAVFGDANLLLNNGYIGYEYSATEPTDNTFPYIHDKHGGYYQEKINDDTYKVDGVYAGDGRLKDCGNVFGGGYDVRSSVDNAKVTMYNGVIRNSLLGGAEIATIGRGAATENNAERTVTAIYKAGTTFIEMYNGHVMRNVFGGGKGYNIYGYGQSGTLYTDGYVFGSTEVHIHGGEVGTQEGVADGYGNVFGGGDIGYVYSKGYFNSRTVSEKAANPTGSTGSPNHWYYYYNDGTGDHLTEDCKVLIAPELQRKSDYTYASTDELNTLPAKEKGSSTWPAAWDAYITADEDGDRGILIHNAVFGGGNVSSNNDTQYANATTVHGNTTATLYDVYNRDFITIGTEHTGGLYGGGNWTLVDGYRELNITNYGTDYYGLESEISLEQYRNLSSRERAYFQLKYQCNIDITLDEEYEKGETITEEEYLKLVELYGDTAKNAFTPFGFCSIYAGRLLNTIQRADFCGVFGSRMVLQGAQDRVADVSEDIDYTINRVGELSLNIQRKTIGDDSDLHGNYFGIYSVVNYMGNLTSDVAFGDIRRYKNGDTEANDPDGKSYYKFKKDCYASGSPLSTRNNGCSHNQVALASGVFLEMINEKTELDPDKKKDYGYITGVVELDLINVKKDMVGGGFVYAKNEHRVPKHFPNMENVLLSPYNKIENNEARTYKHNCYDLSDEPTGEEAAGASIISGEDASNLYHEMEWETSGNFIHPSKIIVDDCYPTNNAYKLSDPNRSVAHYWYIKGNVYIYDQEVSAYTGAASAYSKEVHLPLTITAASHGRLQLLNVKPNVYAYYASDANGNKVKIGTNDTNGKPIEKVWVNNDNDGYGLNEVVTWWDWYQMSAADRRYFVAETYVNCEPCTIDGTSYETGAYVMDDTDFNTFKGENHTITMSDGTTVTMANITDLFRSSNNIGHDTGYVLTFDMNSPDIWNDYYTKIESSTPESDKIRESEYQSRLDAAATEADKQAIIDTWREGPTFTPQTTGVYGQRQIEVGNILTKDEVDRNETGSGTQAIVEKAYVAIEAVTYEYNSTTKTTNAGTAIPISEYNSIDATAKSSFELAFVCTQTLKLAEDKYLFYGDLFTANDITDLKRDHSSFATDIQNIMKEAYICSSAGGFGGQRFETGKNYNALTTWCSLSESERKVNGTDSFTFNYDAFDLLADPEFLVIDVNETKIEVDQANKTEIPNTANSYHSPYSDKVGVEYQAVFKATTAMPTYTYSGGILHDGDAIDQDIFEAEVRNDKSHYTSVSIKGGGETIYIATNTFVYNGVPYGKGQVVDESVYTNNTDKVEPVQFANSSSQAVVKYYCYEDYPESNPTVTKGTVISDTEFSNLRNDQQYFVIQGKEPTETTTLYVSSESDIKDVTTERVYTVVYQYTYYEDQDDGSVKLNSELHVINVHIDLKSGAPYVGDLMPPGTVLPNWSVGLTPPTVKPGIIPIITNGWELFLTEDDAINHRNGATFENNGTPVYWYQNQKNFIRFYSQTHRGKTYSTNYVPLSVANYHDLDALMNDTAHHFYVDRSDVDRASKIYIDNRNCKSDANKSELDLLKDFFDLSLLTSSDVNTDENGLITTIKGSDPAVDSDFKGHGLLSSHVRAGRNLDFILRSDVAPKAYTTWTPIGNDNVYDDPSTTADEGVNGECFDGTLHGDGYTISGLTSSLFGHLCGDVYNLGVTGSFTGAGIADEGYGYMENCWVTSSATSVDNTVKAVFNNPLRSSGTQVVNCYYPESNAYSTTSHDRGNAIMMPDKAFYNGTVAYNLNGFYLKKRYYDNNTSWTGTKKEYQYLPSADDGTLPDNMATAYYPEDYAVYQPDLNIVKGEKGPYMGYVENRFYDGDFIYAGGTIPENNNMRMRTVTTTTTTIEDGNEITTTTSKNYFTPIWPDDYLFFGQVLNYGHGDRSHQENPTRINRTNERVDYTDDGNRVYRAPAYFRSGKMDVAHFNPAAIFAKTKKSDNSVIAYKNMTAIDFTGGNGDVAAGYQNGNITAAPYNNIVGGAFFPPLLDDDGLSSFRNVDLTNNLLVYTKASTKTDNVVSTYLPDEAYVEKDPNYRTVDAWDIHNTLRGHWVQQTTGGAYTALRDHMLVDKHDFYAPISYQFTKDYRMWYQRMPDNYVDIAWVDHDNNSETPLERTTKGWEGVSLPFKADIVTTDVKGELTHFYGGSTTGHEYWLREFTGISGVSGTIMTATLDYPAANSADGQKDYANTFLWDYYYSHNEFDDLNRDDYQEDDENRNYYRTGREYADYPRLASGTPYLIGFPGKRYYEFDLSGEFLAETAKGIIPVQLERQTITFASATGAIISKSDDEMSGTTQTYNSKDYTFKPTYLNEPDLETGKNAFLLNNDGDKYVMTPSSATTVAVSAFRPYFIAGSSSSGAAPMTRSIVFSNNTNEDGGGIQTRDDNEAGALSISTRRHAVIVTSTLRHEVPVTIVTTSGVVVAHFTIQPGETIETNLPNVGIYIVNGRKVVIK